MHLSTTLGTILACPLSNLSPVFGPSIEKNANKRSDHLATRETAGGGGKTIEM